MAFIGGPTYGVALPGSPVDGHVHILTNSLTTPSWTWTFRYNASSTFTYKWEFIGGTPIISGGWTGSTTSTSYVTATGGTAITVPNSGDYVLSIGGYIGGNAQSGEFGILTTNVPSDGALVVNGPGNGQSSNTSADGYVSALTAAAVMSLRYRSSNGVSVNLSGGWISLLPRRIT